MSGLVGQDLRKGHAAAVAPIPLTIVPHPDAAAAPRPSSPGAGPPRCSPLFTSCLTWLEDVPPSGTNGCNRARNGLRGKQPAQTGSPILTEETCANIPRGSRSLA